MSFPHQDGEHICTCAICGRRLAPDIHDNDNDRPSGSSAPINIRTTTATITQTITNSPGSDITSLLSLLETRAYSPFSTGSADTAIGSTTSLDSMFFISFS